MSVYDQYWAFFMVIGVLLMIAEIAAPGFVLLPIGVGFILTGFIALFIDQLPILFAILALIEVIIFIFSKKYLRKFFRTSTVATAVEGMIGKEAVVMEPIRPGEVGQVKLYGDLWTAQSSGRLTLEKGTRVRIVKIDGNRVIVEPLI